MNITACLFTDRSERYTIPVVDLTEFIQAGPDDRIVIIDGDGGQDIARKGDLRDFQIE